MTSTAIYKQLRLHYDVMASSNGNELAKSSAQKDKVDYNVSSDNSTVFISANENSLTSNDVSTIESADGNELTKPSMLEDKANNTVTSAYSDVFVLVDESLSKSPLSQNALKNFVITNDATMIASTNGNELEKLSMRINKDISKKRKRSPESPNVVILKDLNIKSDESPKIGSESSFNFLNLSENIDETFYSESELKENQPLIFEDPIVVIDKTSINESSTESQGKQELINKNNIQNESPCLVESAEYGSLEIEFDSLDLYNNCSGNKLKENEINLSTLRNVNELNILQIKKREAELNLQKNQGGSVSKNILKENQFNSNQVNKKEITTTAKNFKQIQQTNNHGLEKKIIPEENFKLKLTEKRHEKEILNKKNLEKPQLKNKKVKETESLNKESSKQIQPKSNQINEKETNQINETECVIMKTVQGSNTTNNQTIKNYSINNTNLKQNIETQNKKLIEQKIENKINLQQILLKNSELKIVEKTLLTLKYIKTGSELYMITTTDDIIELKFFTNISTNVENRMFVLNGNHSADNCTTAKNHKTRESSEINNKIQIEEKSVLNVKFKANHKMAFILDIGDVVEIVKFTNTSAIPKGRLCLYGPS